MFAKILSINGEITSKAPPATPPLIMAIMRSDAEEARNLLRSVDVNVNAIDSEGRTALIAAVFKKNLDILLILLSQSGLKINQQDNKGQNALMWAVIAAKPDAKIIEQLLIKPNIDINMCDNNGETALIIAARLGNIEIVKILLNNRAKVDIKNAKGLSAYQMTKSDPIKKILLAAAAGRNFR